MHMPLTPQLEAMIREKVGSSHYKNASQIIREALSLMQANENVQKLKLERLRIELDKAETDFANGNLVTLRNDAELSAFFEKL
ncbi:ribbon-helix-helix domain-containing protein [Thalassospira alkalitolerans]|uniref:CopG family transcriptional regulator n=1 Tax=Thalassospira alkalitolerans TaxID=1293890 RepID=A0A1Y2L6F1_9PROT|nr:type II toxin-antitoxin system ParD family antitoxin [Thalassospira alkalitolerans]OSQ43813.1 hypothetical protein TALK_19780 [Thalassospira alkalitolerans]